MTEVKNSSPDTNPAVKFQQEAQPIKKKAKPIRKMPIENGLWDGRQQRLYVSFMRKYYYIMKESSLRHHYSIFNKMADSVGTRTSAQCKSHHQKMMIKYHKCIEDLIFEPQSKDRTIHIGQGLDNINHEEAARIGIKRFHMTPETPWLIAKVKNYVVVRIETSCIQSY